MQLIISRFDVEAVGGGRGVRMWAPEPDYASRQLMIFLAFIFFFWIKKEVTSRWAVVSAVIVSLSIILLNKSVTGMVLLLSFLGPFLFLRVSVRTRILIVIGSAVLLPLLIYSALTQLEENYGIRALDFIVFVIERIQAGDITLAQIFSFASARLVTVLAGYMGFVGHWGIGIGVGKADAYVLDAFFNTPFFADIPFDYERYKTLKPMAWLAGVALEVGLLAVVPFVLLIGHLIRRTLSMTREHMALASGFIACALIQLALNSIHSLIAPWLMLALTASMPLASEYYRHSGRLPSPSASQDAD